MDQVRTTPADDNHPHSIYGASGAKAWRSCSAGPLAVQAAKADGRIPPRTESEHSKLGTRAHDKAEQWLMSGEKPDFEGDHDMEKYVGFYVDRCIRARSEDSFDIIEGQVPLWYRPQDTGTLDYACVSDDHLQFMDLKYGAGVQVKAEDNDQLAIYAISLLKQLEARGQEFADSYPVALGIFQPRWRECDPDDPDTMLDVWITSYRDLMDMAIDIEADYQKAQDPERNEFKPSDEACQFCDLKGICEARGGQAFESFAVVTDDEIDGAQASELVTARSHDTLSQFQIDKILATAPAIKKMIADVEKAEFARLNAGGEQSQHKLILGKPGHKKWLDQDKAAAYLKRELGVAEAVKPSVPITPTQALKKLGKDMTPRKKANFEKLFFNPEGKVTMVHVSDKRDAITIEPTIDSFEEDFGDLI